MMEGTVRRSPVHDAVERLDPEWGRIGSAPVALHFGDPEGEAALKERLGLCDVSALKRFGVKGPNAHRWLLDRGVEVPEPANSWLPLSDGRGLVARLGRSEFLVGDSLNSGTRGIYPVVRHPTASRSKP